MASARSRSLWVPTASLDVKFKHLDLSNRQPRPARRAAIVDARLVVARQKLLLFSLFGGSSSPMTTPHDPRITPQALDALLQEIDGCAEADQDDEGFVGVLPQVFVDAAAALRSLQADASAKEEKLALLVPPVVETAQETGDGAGLICENNTGHGDTLPRPICPCDNPHCDGFHPDTDRLFRIVRAQLIQYRNLLDPDRGDLVIAEEAILSAARNDRLSRLRIGSAPVPLSEASGDNAQERSAIKNTHESSTLLPHGDAVEAAKA